MKITIGFLLALAIGAACRLASIPLPAPPMLIGALLVVAMTLGYVAADGVATGPQSRRRTNRGGLSGRPDGVQR